LKYFVYVLLSLKNSHLYIGYTNNLVKRLVEHSKGKVNSTKPFLPYRLIYTEKFNNSKDALLREKELKTTEGRRFLKQFIH
jgi:putative endonuclease